MKTDFTQKALDGLVIFEPHQNKHTCGICAKQYKHAGTAQSHVQKEHPEFVQCAMEELTEKAELNEMAYYHKMLFTYSQDTIRRTHKNITEAKEKLDKDFEYAFSWVTEELLKDTQKVRLLYEVKRIIEFGETIQDIWSELVDYRNELKNEVLDNFPRHNSSSEFSNIHDRLKMQAKAEFAGSRIGGSFLSEIIRIANKLSNFADKEEE